MFRLEVHESLTAFGIVTAGQSLLARYSGPVMPGFRRRTEFRRSLR